LHDLFGSLFSRTPPASIQFLFSVQADFIAKGVILSEIDVDRRLFSHFLFIEREATIAEALQLSKRTRSAPSKEVKFTLITGSHPGRRLPRRCA
jgi:hypothetical protein